MHLFDTFLLAGQPVLIAIRDLVPDENNPLTATDVQELWETIYAGNPNVKVIIIPDIASVNYGRGVGYTVNEVKVPEGIANISATEIREQIIHGRHEWKQHVDEKIHDLLEQKIRQRIQL